MKLIMGFVLQITFVLSGFSYASETNERSKITSAVLKGTVLVSTKLKYGFAEDKKASGSWYGSGFLIDRDRGWIATNAHVAGVGVVDNYVEFYKSKDRVKVERLYLDSKYDFAILQIPPVDIPEDVLELNLDCDGEPLPGSRVIAVGHPRNHEFSSTYGIISGEKDFNAHGSMWITDLVVESGSSGSPVVDVESMKVLGLTTANYRGSDLGLVTRSKDLCPILEILKRGGDPSRPQLNFDLAVVDGNISNKVALVHDQDIELVPGDLLLGVDGVSWEPEFDGDLFDLLRSKENAVTVRRNRDGEQQDVSITLIKQGSLHKRPWVYFSGLTIAESTQVDLHGLDQIKPLMVQSVDLDEVVQRDFEFGRFTQVMTVNGVAVSNVTDLIAVLEEAQKNSESVAVGGKTWDLSSESMMRVFEYQIEIDGLDYAI